ncbi:MAG: hypothetical protein EOS17_16790 [Mesorhizobium sp.]|nr:MAG: hypothetical protein EOS17_16790 [Mesorhizobium sp.]
MSDQPARYKVKNWEQFQHYRDRNPPWIKLHFAILASEDWVMLDDASRVLMFACMLVASKNEGMVPNNPAYLKRVAYLNRTPNFNPLISCGFLEIPLADASALQAHARAVQADARPEKRQSREEKSLSETSSDERPVSKSSKAYPEDFEAFWLDYPRSPNMSKAKALAGWVKLSEQERKACREAVPAYRAFLTSKPDHPTMHAVTFINERRFEGFVEQAAASAPRPVTPQDWGKRLAFGRQQSKWHVEQWGPRPGDPECRVPEHLLQPGDGQAWAVWEA